MGIPVEDRLEPVGRQDGAVAELALEGGGSSPGSGRAGRPARPSQDTEAPGAGRQPRWTDSLTDGKWFVVSPEAVTVGESHIP